jgi:hypothetical protein
MEALFQFIAVAAYLFCGFRIICFNPAGNHHSGYALLAAFLIASFMGQTVHILFFKDPVTLWDAVFAVLLAVIIYRARGNVCKLIWSAA